MSDWQIFGILWGISVLTVWNATLHRRIDRLEKDAAPASHPADNGECDHDPVKLQDGAWGCRTCLKDMTQEMRELAEASTWNQPASATRFFEAIEGRAVIERKAP